MSTNSVAPASEVSFDDAVRLAGGISALIQSVEGLRRRIAEIEKLTSTEFRAIARIGENVQLTPKSLSKSLDLTSGAVTSVTDRLVALDLIERVPHPDDRRSVLLQLTSKGADITGRIRLVYGRSVVRALGGREANDLEALDSSLRQIAAALAAVEVVSPDTPA